MKKWMIVLVAAMMVTACKPAEKAPADGKPAAEGEAKDEAAKAAATDKPAAATDKPAAATDKPADAPKAAAASQPADDREEGHFGAPFAEAGDAVALAAVIDKIDEHAGETVKITGTVDKVCRRKGCWMVVKSDKEGQEPVRITMKDYGFFVPKQCDGSQAIIEGVISKKEVSEAQLKHLAEDEGKDPSTIKGSKVELSIVANGIEIKKKG